MQGYSGRAYTQVFSPTSTQSAEPYSKNGPFQVTTDVRLNRFFRLGGQRLDFSIAGLNIFGTRVVNRVDRVTGEGRVWGVGEYDPNVFDVNEYTKVSEVDDQSNYGPPAQWRFQLDFDF